MRSQDFGFQGLGRIMFLANTEESFFVKVRSLKLDDDDENNIFILDYKQQKINYLPTRLALFLFT